MLTTLAGDFLTVPALGSYMEGEDSQTRAGAPHGSPALGE